ncbi:MAG: peroxiredoxin family protein [Deferrisomatales bacterium]
MNRLHRGALVLLFAAAVAGGPGCSGDPVPESPRIAPDFTLTALDREPVRLSDHRGRVVLLDFWATWCAPCRVSIPHLVELQEKYRGDGLVVIGMNMDHDQQELEAFLRRQTINYPVVAVTEELRAAYGGVVSIPLAFAVDRKGHIRQRFLGYDRRVAKDMEQTIQTLLREAP